MERCAVEARQTRADVRPHSCETRIAWRQEIVAACVGDQMIVRRAWQAGAYRFIVVRPCASMIERQIESPIPRPVGFDV